MKLPWRKGPFRTPVSLTLYSKCNGHIVGVVRGMTDEEVTYLTDLYIAPRYRRQGRGKALVEQFLSSVKNTTVILLTSEATEFYRKLGFVERTAMVWRKE